MIGELLPSEIHCFEPSDDVNVSYGQLPHWHQAGTISFITWRTWDSMPMTVIRQWIANREEWLTRNGIDARHADWKLQLSKLKSEERREFQTLLADRWEQQLDRGHGSCPLSDPVRSKIVADSLRHFDGDRYWLSDFVIMPNHVHLLAAFPDGTSLTAQCESWKHFTATRLNRMLKRNGRFWETESFDHLVRSEIQYEHLRRYIADNPMRAK